MQWTRKSSFTKLSHAGLILAERLALATRRTPRKNRPDAIKRAQSSNPWSFTVIISERVHSRGQVRACKIAVPRHASPLPFN